MHLGTGNMHVCDYDTNILPHPERGVVLKKSRQRRVWVTETSSHSANLVRPLVVDYLRNGWNFSNPNMAY